MCSLFGDTVAHLPSEPSGRRRAKSTQAKVSQIQCRYDASATREKLKRYGPVLSLKGKVLTANFTWRRQMRSGRSAAEPSDLRVVRHTVLRSLLILGAALLLDASASANPMLAEVLRVRQVPGTVHVQVTFATMLDRPDRPQQMRRDGERLDGVQWSTIARFIANNGSGLSRNEGYQACDCNVADGVHRYEVKLPQGEMAAEVKVVRGYVQPPRRAAPKGTHPWDIPEPTEVQGIDCVKDCLAVAKTTGRQPVRTATLLLAGCLALLAVWRSGTRIAR